LSEEGRKLVEEFYPFPKLWDISSPNDRRKVTLDWDAQNDPAQSAGNDIWSSFDIRIGSLETRIKQLTAQPAEERDIHLINRIVDKKTRMKQMRKNASKGATSQELTKIMLWLRNANEHEVSLWEEGYDVPNIDGGNVIDEMEMVRSHTEKSETGIRDSVTDKPQDQISDDDTKGNEEDGIKWRDVFIKYSKNLQSGKRMNDALDILAQWPVAMKALNSGPKNINQQNIANQIIHIRKSIGESTQWNASTILRLRCEIKGNNPYLSSKFPDIFG